MLDTAIANGMNAAVVFDQTLSRLNLSVGIHGTDSPVIDGDKDDLRFLIQRVDIS